MKKTIIFILAILLGVAHGFSQGTAINSTGAAADNSAILDLSSASKGLRITRVGLTDTSSGVTPINNPANGLLVYDTLTGSAGSGISPGFYYWDATKTQWLRLATSSSTSSSSSSNLGNNLEFHQVLFLTSTADNSGAQWTVPIGYIWEIKTMGCGSSNAEAPFYLYVNGANTIEYHGHYNSSTYCGPRSRFCESGGTLWLPAGTYIGTVTPNAGSFRWISGIEYKIVP